MIYCPECGSERYGDNRLDLRGYEDVPMQASCLRHFGKYEAADGMMREYYTMHFENDKRLPWRCLDCDVTYV